MAESWSPWGKSIFSARDPADPKAPSLPQRKEGDTRSGWDVFNRVDKSFPSLGIPQGAHEGSQSQTPNKENQ